MGYLTLIMALAISGVAAWYSIIGLMAIFSGSKIAIAIMGTVLETGKLVTATWLHRNWKTAPILLRSYLTGAVIVLMLITSMGIFGFLSKAHLDQTIQIGGTNALQISNLKTQLEQEQRSIASSERVIGTLEQTVQTLIDYDRIRGPQGAIAVRDSQKQERDSLNASINASLERISEIQNELAPLEKQQISFKAELGPLTYIADAIYGSAGDQNVDNAVRYVILIIIFVFDPLAVLLLLAANISLQRPVVVSASNVQTIDAAVIDDISQSNSQTVQIQVSELSADQLDNYSKQDLALLLADVDRRLNSLYTNNNTLEHKHELRSLQRVRNKIMTKLNEVVDE